MSQSKWLMRVCFLVCCLISLFRHHQELEDSDDSTNAELFTSSRFIPIVAFTLLEMMSVIPITIGSSYINFSMGLQPFDWNLVHSSFYIIPVFSSVVWRSNPLTISALEMQRWISSGCGILIFLFFGTTKEARKHYSKALCHLLRRNV